MFYNCGWICYHFECLYQRKLYNKYQLNRPQNLLYQRHDRYPSIQKIEVGFFRVFFGKQNWGYPKTSNKGVKIVVSPLISTEHSFKLFGVPCNFHWNFDCMKNWTESKVNSIWKKLYLYVSLDKKVKTKVSPVKSTLCRLPSSN